MNVPRDCREPAPNFYKQCAAPIDQWKSDQWSRTESGDQIRREIKRDREGVRAEPIRELWVSPRIAGEVRISPELRVRSKSSIRPDDSVNCAWLDYNQLRIPLHLLFDLSVPFRHERISFM